MGHSRRLTAVLLLGIVIGTEMAHAGEVRFMAGPIAEDRAIWEPTMVLIDKDDIRGGLTFVLDNPSKVEHAFAVTGLHELIMEKETIRTDPAAAESGMLTYTLRPIRVTIPPGEIKRIKVDISNLTGPHAVGRRFKYFCPIHKDMHLGGSIYIVD